MINDKCKENMEEGLENFALWAALKNQKPNIPLLKEAVDELCHILTQKTAGQRRNKPKDVPFDSLPRIKMIILAEATALVMSGALDGLEADHGKE